MIKGMADPFITSDEVDPETAAYIAAVKEGIADADAGRTIPYEVGATVDADLGNRI